MLRRVASAVAFFAVGLGSLVAAEVPAMIAQPGPTNSAVKPLLEKGKYEGRWASGGTGGRGTLYLTVISVEGAAIAGTFYLSSGFPAPGFNEDIAFTATAEQESLMVNGANGMKFTLEAAGSDRYRGQLQGGRGGTIEDVMRTR